MKDHLYMRLPGIFRFTMLTIALCSFGIQWSFASDGLMSYRDTIPGDSGQPVNLIIPKAPVGLKQNDTLDILKNAMYPNLSVQQMLKGNLRGLFVQEPNGEPGTEQNMFVRGLAMPLFSKKDLSAVQPTVFLNGIPLLQDNVLVYDIQQYEFNRLGPATNFLNNLNLDNIESIEIIKDADGKLGPWAANGAINIITKQAKSGDKLISVNSYFGMNLYDPIYTTNAAYENNFRRPFYQKYAGSGDSLIYPAYLRDSSNMDYYGPANWTDKYFDNTFLYGINASISGGSERANFRFFANKETNNGVADNTKMDKYNANFLVNMSPIKWLMASAMVNATRIDRQRNTSMRDRFGEMNYIPDVSAPLPPSANGYQKYQDALDKSFDKNHLNLVQGSFSLSFDLKKFQFISRIGYDYNESSRDVFWPSILSDNSNYVSNYFGGNQRVMLENILRSAWKLSADSRVQIELGQSLQSDEWKYSYTRAYRGYSDRIKVNLVDGDKNSVNYLLPTNFGNQLVFRYIDKTKHRLVSLYANAVYSFRDIYQLSVTLRNDGSSYMNAANRWFFTPTISGSMDIKSKWFETNDAISDWRLSASWGRMGRLLNDDRFGAGPQYRVELGWEGNKTAYSYNAFAGLSRPYTSGYVADDFAWPYTDITNVSTDISLFENRLMLNLAVYNKNDKNMIIGMPAIAESGYTVNYANGLEVNNKGFEIGLAAAVIKKRKVSLTPFVNFSKNRNELKALPGGATEFVSGSRKLEVGKPIDAFWLYENKGIYNSDSEVPIDSKTGEPMNFIGAPFQAGDPIWNDTNGDFVVNDEDKVLKGHSLPTYSGNFGFDFVYGKFNLGATFYYAGGHSAINEKTAARYDFINRDGRTDMNSVKDITFWQKDLDMKSYPVYNPWSAVVPYRVDQDLFLENASFVKLRALTIGYDLTGWRLINKKGYFKKFYVYATGNNLLTFTNYTGGDPELVQYNGYDNFYALPIPKTYTIGIKMDL
ncbi:SusC/RagA family TonB-linked outer membrane protein [Chitinophaga caeni]|nr:SusC/RagA family TonB-linked outer membrane protein [Chitinophaga caeni]